MNNSIATHLNAYDNNFDKTYSIMTMQEKLKMFRYNKSMLSQGYIQIMNIIGPIEDVNIFDFYAGMNGIMPFDVVSETRSRENMIIRRTNIRDTDILLSMLMLLIHMCDNDNCITGAESKVIYSEKAAEFDRINYKLKVLDKCGFRAGLYIKGITTDNRDDYVPRVEFIVWEPDKVYESAVGKFFKISESLPKTKPSTIKQIKTENINNWLLSYIEKGYSLSTIN